MPHIVLLGDSIFDNGRYTLGAPDIISNLRKLLPSGWKSSLLAQDGSTTADISKQLEALPIDASHLVLSVGGNDAIMNAGILNAPTASSAEALALLAEVSKKFEKAYREVIEACTRGLPLTICTIYNGSFPDTHYQELISTALTIFNDVILRVGIERHFSVIDLRFVCSKAEDFANPLEPSSIGGAKIARLIFEVVSVSSRDDIGARIFAL